MKVAKKELRRIQRHMLRLGANLRLYAEHCEDRARALPEHTGSLHQHELWDMQAQAFKIAARRADRTVTNLNLARYLGRKKRR